MATLDCRRIFGLKIVVVESGAPCRTRTCDFLVRSCGNGKRNGCHRVLPCPIWREILVVPPFEGCYCVLAFRTTGGHKSGHIRDIGAPSWAWPRGQGYAGASNPPRFGRRRGQSARADSPASIQPRSRVLGRPAISTLRTLTHHCPLGTVLDNRNRVADARGRPARSRTHRPTVRWGADR
jgi:hypothetical protein